MFANGLSEGGRFVLNPDIEKLKCVRKVQLLHKMVLPKFSSFLLIKYPNLNSPKKKTHKKTTYKKLSSSSSCQAGFRFFEALFVLLETR